MHWHWPIVLLLSTAAICKPDDDGRSESNKVHVGISKVRYSDGTTAEVYPIDYWNWTM